MSEKLNRANRILDRACKQAGMNPVAVRVAMVNAIKDRQRMAAFKPASGETIRLGKCIGEATFT